MKKTLYLIGLISTIFTFLGSFFKIMHWPGASVIIIMGALSLAFIFVPLLIFIKLFFFFNIYCNRLFSHELTSLSTFCHCWSSSPRDSFSKPMSPQNFPPFQTGCLRLFEHVYFLQVMKDTSNYPENAQN